MPPLRFLARILRALHRRFEHVRYAAPIRIHHRHLSLLLDPETIIILRFRGGRFHHCEAATLLLISSGVLVDGRVDRGRLTDCFLTVSTAAAGGPALTGKLMCTDEVVMVSSWGGALIGRSYQLQGGDVRNLGRLQERQNSLTQRPSRDIPRVSKRGGV